MPHLGGVGRGIQSILNYAEISKPTCATRNSTSRYQKNPGKPNTTKCHIIAFIKLKEKKV